jgi:hypothetical protein
MIHRQRLKRWTSNVQQNKKLMNQLPIAKPPGGGEKCRGLE